MWKVQSETKKQKKRRNKRNEETKETKKQKKYRDTIGVTEQSFFPFVWK